MLVDRLNKLIEPIVIALGYELWNCELIRHKQGATLQVHIDSPNGVSLEDCSLVSKRINPLLDVEESLKNLSRVEVSSPGVNRPLVKVAHYKRFIGQQVALYFREPRSGRRTIKGLLRSVVEDQIMVESEGQSWTLPISAMSKAHLIPELSFKR